MNPLSIPFRLRGFFRPVLFPFLAACVTGAFVPIRAQTPTLEIDDLRLEVGVSTPVLSPDGRWAVVTTSTPNYEENRFDRTLILVDVSSGEARDLTPHRPGVGQPRWSPAGDRLAFVDSGEEGDGAQVYVLTMAGGEARQVTEAGEGVGVFQWAADGTHLFFTTRDVVEEVEGEERHNKSFEVGNNSYLTRQAPRSAHLWRVPVAGGEAERLTEGPESVGGFLVSPDGATVAMEVTPRPHSGEGIRTTIRFLDLATGDAGPLDEVPPVYLARFSPDGGWLAFSRSRGPEPYFHPSGIFLKAMAGSAPVDPTRGIDRNLGGMAWLPDGESILVSGTDLTAQALWL